MLFLFLCREKEENLERRLELLTGELREILDIEGKAAIGIFFIGAVCRLAAFPPSLFHLFFFLTLFLTHERNMVC